ncbi:hypothetical protein LZ32DRAFT_358840 [Colletotrichum eremochloae]|nr:hypothetical protein LZ32DRAFT_358840 [Colletotrichum eremochloae]
MAISTLADSWALGNIDSVVDGRVARSGKDTTRIRKSGWGELLSRTGSTRGKKNQSRHTGCCCIAGATSLLCPFFPFLSLENTALHTDTLQGWRKPWLVPALVASGWMAIMSPSSGPARLAFWAHLSLIPSTYLSHFVITSGEGFVNPDNGAGDNLCLVACPRSVSPRPSLDESACHSTRRATLSPRLPRRHAPQASKCSKCAQPPNR